VRPLLVPVDYSPATGAQLEQAALLAKALCAPVYMLHVEAPDPDFVGYGAGPPHVRDEAASETLQHHVELRVLRDGLRMAGVDAHALVIQGRAAEKILDEAERLDAAMIILGAHAHSLLRHWLTGEVGEPVLRQARRPVLVVPEP
jgi:nucleotide-binding universal stress UspA family protein